MMNLKQLNSQKWNIGGCQKWEVWENKLRGPKGYKLPVMR